jgi:hypothetical protein
VDRNDRDRLVTPRERADRRGSRNRARLLVRLVLAGVAARALFQIAAYCFQRFDVRRHHIESSLLVLAALGLAALFVERETEVRPASVGGFPAWTVPAATLAGAFILFWPALSVGFLSDDFVLADRAMRGEFVAHTHEFVRPVPLVVWRMLFITGGGATAIHALNIFLHGVNGALTARLARAMGARPGQALFAAMLFVVWPTQVESVTWASGVFDVLMTTLVLTVVNVYLSALPALTSERIAAITIVTGVALLTKETAAAVPALLLTVSARRWTRQRPRGRELAAFAVVAGMCAAYMVWRVVLRTSVVTVPHPVLSRYAIKELLSRTFGTLAMPFTAEWTVTAPLLVTVFATIVLCFLVLPIVAGSRRGALKEYNIAGVVWPAIAAAPALGYLFIGASLEGSRYLYLPAVGWAIFVAAAAQSTAALWRAMVPVVTVCSAALVTVSILESRSLVADWSAAAAQRDAIVAEAGRALQRDSCRSGHFAGAPAAYKGAQVFKNGIDEAVRGPGMSDSDVQGCEFVWEGQRFVRK